MFRFYQEMGKKLTRIGEKVVKKNLETTLETTTDEEFIRHLLNNKNKFSPFHLFPTKNYSQEMMVKNKQQNSVRRRIK